MFAYCNNNPINFCDPTGEILISTLILIGSAIVGAACAGYTAYTTYNAGYATEDIIFYSVGAGLGGFLTVYTLGMSAYQVYLNYCILNGITPVTEVMTHAQAQAVESNASHAPHNPLENIKYTEKVQQQKNLSDFHGFPDIVDNYGGYGYQQTIIGGDGSTYSKLSIPGSYHGYDGAFVYIWDDSGFCNHRFFEVNYK